MMKFELENDAQRQLLVRALAVQAIQSPGFADASRKIAVRFSASVMFDSFIEAMADWRPPPPGWWEKHKSDCASLLPMYAIETACDCGAYPSVEKR